MDCFVAEPVIGPAERPDPLAPRNDDVQRAEEQMTKDLDDLTKLNKDYVDSVQNCDVRRFDEILAPDFYCTNSDKSLVDRAAFLKQTAIPVKIRNLKAED